VRREVKVFHNRVGGLLAGVRLSVHDGKHFLENGVRKPTTIKERQEIFVDFGGHSYIPHH